MNKIAGVFIIGTDTEVGKTYQACKLARAVGAKNLRVGVYKPVASGLVTEEHAAEGLSSDAALLQAAAGTSVPLARICPQSFRAAVAPPLAARLEGREVDENMLRAGAEWWKNACDYLIVEGAGGALSPISDSLTVLDLACELGLPLIVVAANRLGVVNHLLLTLEALASRSLKTIGVVLNDLPSSIPLTPDALLARQTNYELLRQFVDADIEITDAMETLLPRLDLPSPKPTG